MDRSATSPILVAVSGGFDPIHVGHIRLFKAAKRLGDKLLVIVNNDHWLRKKKGFIFMHEAERMEIIQAIADVDTTILTTHPENPQDMSISQALLLYRPHIFANGGDRLSHNTPEVSICQQIACALVFNVGGEEKVQSSSWLLNKHLARIKNGN